MPYVTTTDNTQLYYKEWGRGRPVVVLHHETGTLELRQDAVHGREPKLLAAVEQRAIDRLRRHVPLAALLEHREHLQAG